MYKVGLLGCGRISKKHVEAIAANTDNLELTAVCDVFPEKMKAAVADYSQRTGILPGMHTDYLKMLAQQDLDIIVIATESGYHAKHAMDSLQAGKHVLVEKPMALSMEDCNRMIACAEERGLTLALCHQNRFNPPVQLLRKALTSNKMGRIINGTASIRWSRDQGYYRQAPWRGTWAMDGGTLMNQCLHNIDLLQWMLGEKAETVFAQTGNYIRDIEGEDFGAIIIRFANGSIGIVEGSACVYPGNLEETLCIFGETGTVCLGGMSVDKVCVWNVGDEHIVFPEESGTETIYGNGFTPLYQDLVAALRSGGKPITDAHAGKKAVEIVLAAYKSQLTGMPVNLPLDDFSTMDMTAASISVSKRGL